MVLDADKYRVNMKVVESMMYEKKTPKDRMEFIGAIAVATGVPIIVVACYVGEIFGFTEELKAFIERLKAFYHITEILGVVGLNSLTNR